MHSVALTARQRKFIDAYLLSGNATRAAVAAGYSEKTAYSAGARLLKNVGVSTAISTRQQKATEKADFNLAAHLANLEALRAQAVEAEQFSAAVSAEVSRGKASGFYVEKTETKHSGAIQVTVRVAREGRRVTAS